MSVNAIHSFKCTLCSARTKIKCETQTLALAGIKVMGWGVNVTLKVILCPVCFNDVSLHSEVNKVTK